MVTLLKAVRLDTIPRVSNPSYSQGSLIDHIHRVVRSLPDAVRWPSCKRSALAGARHRDTLVEHRCRRNGGKNDAWLKTEDIETVKQIQFDHGATQTTDSLIEST